MAIERRDIHAELLALAREAMRRHIDIHPTPESERGKQALTLDVAVAISPLIYSTTLPWRDAIGADQVPPDGVAIARYLLLCLALSGVSVAMFPPADELSRETLEQMRSRAVRPN